MAQIQKRSLSQPDEIRTFDHGKVELVQMDGVTFGRATLQPGWKWSTSMKADAKTESCQTSHLLYQISGRLHVVMDDGTEVEFGPGEIASIPPGHDAWVVGDEPVVAMELVGMTYFAEGTELPK